MTGDGGAPRKVVALAAPRYSSARARPLLRELGLVADVVSFRTHQALGTGDPDAVVASSTLALPVLPEVPTVVFVDTAEELTQAIRHPSVAATLSANPELVEHGAIYVPRRGTDVGRWPPLAPLVRKRWRERLSLPDDLVVGIDPVIPEDRPETALAVAAVAVVVGEVTPIALALGTPVVTSESNARRYGLRPGIEVEIAAGPKAAAALAARVAADPAHAAFLSRRGRQAAETRLDMGAPARRVATMLGLVDRPVPHAMDLVELRLTELYVPAHSRLRDRVTAAFEPFPVLTA